MYSPHTSTPTQDDEEHDIKAALNPQKAFHKGDDLLDIGQLTTRGFMQHIHLGEQLLQYYGADFLKGVTHSSAVYVRSTNYARTVQVSLRCAARRLLALQLKRTHHT